MTYESARLSKTQLLGMTNEEHFKMHIQQANEALHNALNSVSVVMDYALENAPEGAKDQLDKALKAIAKARRKLRLIEEAHPIKDKP